LSGATHAESAHPLQPGTPGMVVTRDDGSLMLVPFEGLFCNVPDHHELEDELAAAQVCEFP